MVTARQPQLVAVGLVLVLALAACQPLYVPLVPERLPVTPVFQVADPSALTLVAGVPTLHLVLERVPSAGWLAVQWFAPDGLEAASDSVWVAPADQGQGRTLALPPRVALRSGEWRAVVSFGHEVVRQFLVDVP